MATASTTNATCKDCSTSWYEPILILYQCPFCNSKNIKIDKYCEVKER